MTVSAAPKYLSVGEAIVLLLLIFFFVIVIKIFVPEFYDSIIGRISINLLCFGGPVLLICKLRNLDASYLFPTKRYDGNIGYFFMALIALFLAHRVIQEIEELLAFGLSQYLEARGTWIFNLETRLGTHILSLVIFGPVMEELLFRGLILRSFLKRYSVKKAVIFSTVLFALPHVSLNEHLFSSLFFALASGCFLAWVSIITESIIIAIVCHVLWNALNYVLPFVVMLFGVDVQGGLDLTLLLIAMFTCSIALALLALRGIRRIQPRY